MNIVVLPTDFSELSRAAVPWALKMATALDAQIHCLHVSREPKYYGGLGVNLTDPLATSAELARTGREQMERFLANDLKEAGDAAGEVRIGTPFVEVVRYARQVDATLIVMTTHGHSGLKHVLLGSTTEAVLRKAGCPVLSIRNPEMEFEHP